MSEDITGLCIDEKSFMSMTPKKQMCVLYQNQVKTLELIEGYKFTQKVQYGILSAVLAGIGILFKLQLGI
jgi:hypothetical protein